MFKSLTSIILIVAAALMMGGCSKAVPPGHKGKILGVDGYKPELLVPGRHTVMGRDKLVLLDLTTNRKNLPLKVTMRDYDSSSNARAGLDMDFVLSFRYRLKDNPQIIDTMFNDIKVDPEKGVTAGAVFGVYALPIIETAFRDIVSQFTPEEALAKRAKVNEMVGKEILERLKTNPIEVSDVVVTKMVLPPTIVTRIEKNKDRELKLVEEEAQQAIELAKRENAIVLARKDAAKDLIDAQAASAQNKALDEGLSTKVLELRRLQIAQTYAEAFAQRIANGNQGDTLILPYEAMSSTGGQMRMFMNTVKPAQ